MLRKLLKEGNIQERKWFAGWISTFSSILDMYFFDPSLDCLVGLTSYIKAGLMNYEGIFIYNIMLLHSRPCLPPCTRMRPVLQQNSLQVFSCLPLSPPLCPQFCIQLVYKATLSLHSGFKSWHLNFTYFLVRMLQCRRKQIKNTLLCPWKHEKITFKSSNTLA